MTDIVLNRRGLQDQRRRSDSYMEFKKRVAERVRKARWRAELTQEEAAERMGLCTVYLRQVERGHRNLTLSTLFVIANGLKISVADLVAVDVKSLIALDMDPAVYREQGARYAPKKEPARSEEGIRFDPTELRALRILETARTRPKLGARLMPGGMHGIRHDTLKRLIDAGLVKQRRFWFRLSVTGKRHLQSAERQGK